jgi:hypothetical protein
MPLGSTLRYARWRILVSRFCRLPTPERTIVNTATIAAATAEATAAQSVAFSDKASCQSMSKLAMTDNWSTEETDDPLYADRRNSYKVEKWSRDGQRIEEMLLAGNSLAKARRIFERFITKRPRSRLTIRQRTRVLQEWPPT